LKLSWLMNAIKSKAFNSVNADIKTNVSYSGSASFIRANVRDVQRSLKYN
jgi:hypothetical protein